MAIPLMRRPKHKAGAQTSKTKPPRSRPRDRVDEIAALGSVDPADQFDPGRHEPSYKISEFCRAEGISKTSYYDLKEQGLAPEEIRYRGIIRITYRARIEWQDKMANLPPEMQEALTARAAQRQVNARAAAAKAIKSPKHVSNPQSPWRRSKLAAQTAPPPSRFEHKRHGQRARRDDPPRHHTRRLLRG